ncbi:MAG TPA: N-acetylmuramoyl-L-alanine amidase [Candidatus Paceibacterota bacterium]|nr:N-acetylmuramoyl-L-alanine amidase [Candidatus Paceibacterota bacterium]
MSKMPLLAGIVFAATVSAVLTQPLSNTVAAPTSATQSFTETEAGFDPMPEAMPTPYTLGKGNRYTLEELRTWQRTPGPTRVGVQIGHYQNDEVPEELAGLKRNGAGAVWGPYNERDTVEVVARQIVAELEANGIVVDILPATVPPGYEADVFLAIHADGNPNESVRGYKFAGPRRDYSGRSQVLVDALYDSYGGAITSMPEDPNISRRMTAYYAFNWARYEHAIHPYTPAAIVELGFLTNAADRALMRNQPERLAQAVAKGTLTYLTNPPAVQLSPQRFKEPAQPIVGTLTCVPLREERLRRADRYPCEAGVVTSSGAAYLLPSVASTSPDLGRQVAVTGTFRPVQVLDNYFWFPYEVGGFIEGASVEIRASE